MEGSIIRNYLDERCNLLTLKAYLVTLYSKNAQPITATI